MHTYTVYVVLCMDLDGTAEKKKSREVCICILCTDQDEHGFKGGRSAQV